MLPFLWDKGVVGCKHKEYIPQYCFPSDMPLSRNASTEKNDENMVIIKGNKRVADIYLGEYMRLFSHHSFRESLKWRKPNEAPKPLRTDDWWKDNFGDTARSSRRKFFAKVKS